MYFETGGVKFKAEAKHMWLASTRHDNQRSQMRECLNDARKDIRKSEAKGTMRLAIVFVAPYVTFRSRSKLEQHVKWALDEVRLVEADLVAWTFPCIRKYRTGDNITPGIAMLIDEVHK